VKCMFCKIVNREISSEIIYEDDKIMAFYDINPQAPVHVLVIPRKHIASIAELEEDDRAVMGHLMVKIPEFIISLGLAGRGVRIVNNCLAEAGQSVFHIHFHVLGGRTFGWPPG